MKIIALWNNCFLLEKFRQKNEIKNQKLENMQILRFSTTKNKKK